MPDLAVPPVAAPQRERLGLAEWTVGLSLLFGSLPGPWLTLALPAAVVFAVHDRRVAARIAALFVGTLCALLGAASPGGAVLVTMTAGAMTGSLVAVARGRPATLDALAAPVMGGAAAGLAMSFAALPEAAAAWEAMLRRGIEEGATSALARYRAVGIDPAAVDAMELLLGVVAEWTVRLWPAFAALGLWLGAWLGWRLLARWGRPATEFGERLAGRPFRDFAVGVSGVWVLIGGLGGLWVEPLARAAANAALVAATLFVLDGLAVLWWWLDRRRAGVVIRLVGLTLLFMFAMPLVIAAALALGLADVWLQFRDPARRSGAAGSINA